MIVFSSVSKFFADQPTAIVDFDLEIKPGELVVITGPSGAGKTTLMKLLIREYSPSKGSISFEDKPLEELKAKEIPELRRKIGVVFQDYKLIEDMNVWENIALPLYIAGKKESEIESRVTDLLNLVGLTDRAFHFPRQLSGGEAQRISIARALATAPRVIFADEPTGNLDSAASRKITRLLKKINELGTTILFATHDDLVLEELAGSRIVHLERKPIEQNTETPADTTDEERNKVIAKQEKLARTMQASKETEAKETKEKPEAGKSEKTDKEEKEAKKKEHKKEKNSKKEED